jgi:hypothetical protein
MPIIPVPVVAILKRRIIPPVVNHQPKPSFIVMLQFVVFEASILPTLLHGFADTLGILFPIFLVEVRSFDVGG